MIEPIYDYSSYTGKVLRKTPCKDWYGDDTFKYVIEFSTEDVMPLIRNQADDFEVDDIVIIEAALRNGRILDVWSITKVNPQKIRSLKLREILG